ncbi:MAG: phospho-N-acetylmuramoyl-pentapeptide-transferase, partial [bacterium]|nr:phospho-N-acetylmuramoyl-pentapeptide-transferase [bacterium]
MQSVPLFEAIRILTLAIVAFLVALSLTPFVCRILDKYALKKQVRLASSAPVFHKFHEKKGGTPTMGGVIIWGTTIILALIFWIFSLFADAEGFMYKLNFINRSETYLPLAALFGAGLIGLADDFLGVFKIGPKGGGLSLIHKIFLFVAIAVLGAWWFYFKLDFNSISIPFVDKNYFIGWWYIPFSIFVVTASAFSANETDGLDGLLGGVSLFAFGALTVVAFALGRYDLAAFSSVVMGSLLAFLWFNIYPARFFMGDTGSMSLGITLGVMALLTHTELLLPLFGIILMGESLSVILQVLSKKFLGKKIFHSTPI